MDWFKKNTNAIYALGGALLLWLVSSKKTLAANSGASPVTGMAYPNQYGASRDCDPLGCGHYGAPRGDRTHQGHDFIVTPGAQVDSPIYGHVSRYAYPYSSDLTYEGIEIIGTGIHEGYKVKMFYLVPTIPVGAAVMPGQKVGIAQDISDKHGSSMKPHIHLELYIDGVTVDPVPFF